jgi:hypothetical protein
VATDCPFSQLDYFDVTQSFSPDMHDFLESIVPLVIKLPVQKLHQDKLVTLQQINVELDLLVMGAIDASNRPGRLPKKILSKRLKGTPW